MKPGEEKPIAVTDAYIHGDLSEAAKKIEPGKSTIFKQLEEHAGISVASVTQDIKAVAASADIAEQLKVPRRSPCLRIVRCFIDSSGRPFEISVSHHPGERFAYAMHIEVEGEA
jgi:DNA-binding GntR family transcriptional regulator